jgi:hypothetical protein
MSAISLISMLISGDFSELAVGMSLLMTLVATAIGGIGIIVIAIPLHMLLAHKAIDSALPYLLTGFSISFGFVFLFKPFGNDQIQDMLQQGVIVGIIGTICAVVFWYMAVKYGKPNQVIAAKYDC